MLIPYACPKCQYDVTRTLMDDITVCPECGGAISESTCGPPRLRMGFWRGAGLCVFILLGAYWFNVAFLLGFLRGSMLTFGIHFYRDAIGFTKLGILIAVCEIGCYLVLQSAERRRNRIGATKRTLWKMGLVISAQATLMGSCAWVLAQGVGV